MADLVTYGCKYVREIHNLPNLLLLDYFFFMFYMVVLYGYQSAKKQNTHVVIITCVLFKLK